MAEDKELSSAGAGDGSQEAASANGESEKKVVENGAGGDTNGEPAAGAEPKENGDKTPEEEQQPPVKDMRAVVLSGFGGLKGVKPGKKPEPSAAPETEVLVKVKAW